MLSVLLLQNNCMQPYRWVPRKNAVKVNIALSRTHRSASIWSHDTYFNLSPNYHLYVLFVEISYQARSRLQISYPAILLTMLIGFLNCGSFYRSRHSAGHTTICMFNENQKGNNCTSWEPWGCFNIFRVCPIMYLQGLPVLGWKGDVHLHTFSFSVFIETFRN